MNAAVTDEMAPEAIEAAPEMLRRRIGVPESRRLQANPAMLDEKIEWVLQAARSRAEASPQPPQRPQPDLGQPRGGSVLRRIRKGGG